MKLWILEPDEKNSGEWDPWYDKAFGFVVCAEDEDEARGVASENHGDEGSDVWKDRKQSSCIELTAGDEKGLILRDFASA